MTTRDFAFTIKRTRFDENYSPATGTRLTTNFANLARGEWRQKNLSNALCMINNRFNDLAQWDNPKGDRYSVGLDIISAELHIESNEESVPTIEVLKTTIRDRKTNTLIDGLVGNSFSSYVRDYDFSVLLPEYNKGRASFGVPDDFGKLHAKIFKSLVTSPIFTAQFHKPPVICLSVSENKVYNRTSNLHPVLGVEYLVNEPSLTEQYFRTMGMQVRYFMPPKSVAPLAFYFFGDLLNDYTNLELIGTISTMETFQRIYRPEIYNANCGAGQCFKPSLKHEDYSNTRIVYDREERSRLATKQGRYTEEHFIKPHRTLLDQWSVLHAL